MFSKIEELTAQHSAENHLESLTDSQQIINLLQEQNKILQAIFNFQLKQEKAEFQRTILHLILQAIPYLALIIISYYIYNSLHGYLEALNNNINTLRDGFVSLQNSIGKLIPDFSKLTDGIQNTWQSTKNLFN